jgi:hypothetical protein
MNKDIKNLTDIFQSKQIRMAIIVQNAHHCKNNQRSEAVSSGTCLEFCDDDQAKQYLNKCL